MRFLVFILSLALAASVAAQEKKVEKKTEKKAAKKAEKKKPAAQSQDWGRFNAGAKRDLEKMEKKDAKAKAKSP